MNNEEIKERNNEINLTNLKQKLDNIEKMDYHKDNNIPSYNSNNNSSNNHLNNLPKNDKLSNQSNNKINSLKRNSNLNLNQNNLNDKNNHNDIKKINDIRNNINRSYNHFKTSENNEQNNNLQKKATKGILNFFGVPKKISENISKESYNLEPISTTANISSNVKTIFAGFGILAVLIFVIILGVLGVTVEDDDSDLNSRKEIIDYIKSDNDGKELSNTLKYMNLCYFDDTDDECLNSTAGKYFIHLRELYKKYQNYKDIDGNPIELNISLILETISYDITDSELFDDDNLNNIINESNELAEAQLEHYQEYGDLYLSKVNGCSLTKDKIVKIKDIDNYYRISTDKYVSYLLYGRVHENYQDKIRKIDVDIHPDSIESCIPSGRSYSPNKLEETDTTYEGNLTDGYLYKKTLKNQTDIVDAKKAIQEIFERAKSSNKDNSFNINTICSGVVVTGKNEGVYSLEDYVAGVVQNENSWYVGDNIENMKAQAVAARTYVLRKTNNCQIPIANSDSSQTIDPNFSEQSKRAALETAGQVLVNESGDYISAEYDGLAVKEIIGDYYIIKQANLQIPTSWINANITQKQLDYYASHNHGRGMSQWGSRYLQTQGYNYEEILNTFYTGAKINTLGGTIGEIPNKVDDLKNRYYFIFDFDSYKNGTGFGQCVWYAKHRAMEIIASNNYDESTKQKLINSIKNTPGNGIDWYKSPNSTYFKKSTNINEPKPGSIVSWAWNNPDKINKYGANYGHVAIVEAVYEKDGKTMVTLTEGWRSTCSTGKWCSTNDLWSVANVRRKELTLAQLQTYSGTFNGYVYLS